MFKRLSATVACLATLALLALPAAAEDTVNIMEGLNAVQSGTLAGKIVKVATGVGAIAGAIGVIMMIYCGYRMMTATSDHTRAEARQQFVSVLIGLGVVGMAVLIVSFIANLIVS